MKACLIGAGGIGKEHFISLYKLRDKFDIEKVWVVDIDSDVLSEYVSGQITNEWSGETVRYDKEWVKCVDKITKLDDKIDVWIIAVPYEWHEPYTKYALRKGGNILLEKPAMVDVSISEGKKIFVGYMLSCVDEFEKMCEEGATFTMSYKIEKWEGWKAKYGRLWEIGVHVVNAMIVGGSIPIEIKKGNNWDIIVGSKGKIGYVSDRYDIGCDMRIDNSCVVADYVKEMENFLEGECPIGNNYEVARIVREVIARYA